MPLLLGPRLKWLSGSYSNGGPGVPLSLSFLAVLILIFLRLDVMFGFSLNEFHASLCITDFPCTTNFPHMQDSLVCVALILGEAILLGTITHWLVLRSWTYKIFISLTAATIIALHYAYPRTTDIYRLTTNT